MKSWWQSKQMDLDAKANNVNMRAAAEIGPFFNLDDFLAHWVTSHLFTSSRLKNSSSTHQKLLGPVYY
jgi:hypothetical protein